MSSRSSISASFPSNSSCLLGIHGNLPSLGFFFFARSRPPALELWRATQPRLDITFSVIEFMGSSSLVVSLQTTVTDMPEYCDRTAPGPSRYVLRVQNLAIRHRIVSRIRRILERNTHESASIAEECLWKPERLTGTV